MDYLILSIKDVKKIIFDQQFERFPYLDKFKENPYTYIKARYYMYSSVVLVYLLLRSRITPNMVTISYCLCGVIGGILLSIPNFYFNMIGIFIFFSKGILDWTDGHLARIKYKTTLTGHILDVYGAVLNSIGFTLGLGFFAFHQTNYEFLIYLIAIIAFLHSEVYTSAGKKIIIEDLSKILSNSKKTFNNINKDTKQKHSLNTIKIKDPKWLNVFKDFFDDRARSIDFILLLVIIDIYFEYNFTFYIFLIISLRIFIRFIASFFFGVRSRWAELYVEELKMNHKFKND